MQHKHQTHPAELHGRHQTVTEQVTYEQPLNERIRTLLRLEFLFKQANAHIARHTSDWDNRAMINTLFDVINIFSRSDLKTEIMKELERHALFLEKLAQNPQVDKHRLESVLDEMDVLIDRLHNLSVQDMDFRSNEFLGNIRQRSHIAGGECDFDLPAYHFWLSQTDEKRLQDMQLWMHPFEPIQHAVSLILRLIRESAQSSQEIATSGFFQKSLDASAACQMIRITVNGETPYFAEISGGKHRFTVRFLQSNFNERPSQTDQDVTFMLSCCML